MRRFVYYVATSADGFIARPDGGVDWLERRPPPGHYGFAEFLATVDTVVWGRTTFERFGAAPGGLEAFGAGKRHIVLTHRPPPAGADPRVEYTDGSPTALAASLRATPGKDVWLMGGAASATPFLDAGLVDEIFVHVIPTLIGEGIPLFLPGRRDVELSLSETKAFPDGVVRLRYAVLKPR